MTGKRGSYSFFSFCFHLTKRLSTAGRWDGQREIGPPIFMACSRLPPHRPVACLAVCNPDPLFPSSDFRSLFRSCGERERERGREREGAARFREVRTEETGFEVLDHTSDDTLSICALENLFPDSAKLANRRAEKHLFRSEDLFRKNTCKRNVLRRTPCESSKGASTMDSSTESKILQHPFKYLFPCSIEIDHEMKHVGDGSRAFHLGFLNPDVSFSSFQITVVAILRSAVDLQRAADQPNFRNRFQ